MTESKRLRMWAEQPIVNVPAYLFKYYHQLHIADDEALILLHLCSFLEEGVEFPTPFDISTRTNFSANDISVKLQRLMQKGAIEIIQEHDASGRITEKYSIWPLWERILHFLASENVKQQEVSQQLSEAEIYKLLEQEFGRLLSSIELETVGMWLDQDGHSPEIIKAALREAVLAGKLSLRYIDRILFEWKKKNITSMKQVEQQAEQYRQHTMKPIAGTQTTQQSPATNKVFYNWLEERE
ncbi:MAG: DnaD domain-containing protein [Lysinibacillus sp.]